MPVVKFLQRGNLFWYPLPDDYNDQGPRVIIEALALGLPVIADNKGGAKDRIIPEVGWKCNFREDWIDTLKSIDMNTLAQKGSAARKYAAKKFDPNRWITKILA